MDIHERGSFPSSEPKRQPLTVVYNPGRPNEVIEINFDPKAFPNKDLQIAVRRIALEEPQIGILMISRDGTSTRIEEEEWKQTQNLHPDVQNQFFMGVVARMQESDRVSFRSSPIGSTAASNNLQALGHRILHFLLHMAPKDISQRRN